MLAPKLIISLVLVLIFASAVTTHAQERLCDTAFEDCRTPLWQLIDAETGRDVLSDDTIVEMLKAAGIDIARRTVAKYREAMRIPSSVQRRREKQLAGGATTAS